MACTWAHMTSQAAMRQCFDAITTNPAKILQLRAVLPRQAMPTLMLLRARPGGSPAFEGHTAGGYSSAATAGAHPRTHCRAKTYPAGRPRLLLYMPNRLPARVKN